MSPSSIWAFVQNILIWIANHRGSKFSGQDDSITFVNNYMDHFSGRAPQVGDKVRIFIPASL